jgi:hypothetical protein
LLHKYCTHTQTHHINNRLDTSSDLIAPSALRKVTFDKISTADSNAVPPVPAQATTDNMTGSWVTELQRTIAGALATQTKTLTSAAHQLGSAVLSAVTPSVTGVTTSTSTSTSTGVTPQKRFVGPDQVLTKLTPEEQFARNAADVKKRAAKALASNEQGPPKIDTSTVPNMWLAVAHSKSLKQGKVGC